MVPTACNCWMTCCIEAGATLLFVVVVEALVRFSDAKSRCPCGQRLFAVSKCW